MTGLNPEVDWFFNKKSKWRDEYSALRQIILSTGLIETVKWGCACYMNANANIVLIHGYKEYCALLYFKGALLKDPNKVLVQQTSNVQAARQLRFTSVLQIEKQKKIIISYIKEVVRAEQTGLKISFKKTDEFQMPLEFNIILEEMSDLKKAFYALTPGRQRSYLLYFSEAKQSKTRSARIEKSLQKILDGKGLQD